MQLRLRAVEPFVIPEFVYDSFNNCLISSRAGGLVASWAMLSAVSLPMNPM